MGEQRDVGNLRALIEAGRDPDDASVSGVDTVERYQQ
jgi:hypothetical protein